MTPKGDLQVRLLDAAVDLMGRAGRGGAVEVCGNSMLPSLVPGDLLAVDFSPDRLRRGDLLLFRQADYLVVHRLLGHARLKDGRPCLRTRGDGVIGLDPPLDRSRVVGRVVAVRRGKTWYGFDGGPARAYARMLALHDAAWAAAGAFAYRLERGVTRGRSSKRLRAAVAALDRLLLRVTHRAFFATAHRRVEPPVLANDESGAAKTASSTR